MQNTPYTPCKKQRVSRLLAGAALGVALAAWPSAAHAADGTWSLVGSGNWASPATNWAGSVIPGATSGTTNTDTATFDQLLTAPETITVDTGRNLQNITFGASNSSNNYYQLSGSLLLTSGGKILMQGTAGTFINRVGGVTIEGDGGSSYTFQNDSASSTANLQVTTVTGAATTGVSTLYLDGANAGANVIASTISDGAGGGKLAVVKNGVGTWQFLVNNTFTGGLTINDGTLATGVFAQALGLGPVLMTGGTLDLHGGVSNYTSFTINGNVTLLSNVQNPGPGGAPSLATAPTIANGSTIKIAPGSNVTSGTATLSFNGATFSGATTVDAENAVVSGTTVVGRLFLSVASSLGGDLTLKGNGQVYTNGALSGTGGINLDSSFTGTFITNSALNNTGSTVISGGVFQMGDNGTGGNVIATSSIKDDGTFKVSRIAAGTLQINAAISGTGQILLAGTSGAGNFVSLNAVNTLSGDTTVQFGSLILGANGTLTSSAINLTGSVKSDLNISGVTPASATIKSLSGVAGSTVTLGTKRLVVGDSTNTTYSGTITSTSTAGGITKQGSGTMTLAGANTYTGTTTISAGTLVLAAGGSIANGGVAVNAGQFKVNGVTTSAVSVASGAIVSGTGTLGNLTVSSGGTITPGNSIGILNSGALSLAGGAVLSAEITGAGSSIAGTTNDQLNVTGSVTLGGDLALSLSSFTPVNGTLYFLINNDGSDPIASAFANINGGSTSNNTEFTLGGASWYISYAADYNGGVGSTFTGGNDLALMVVPEPQTLMLCFGAALMIFFRRRARS